MSQMKRPSKRNRSTAWHEAGHAVAADLLGLPFRYVTVEPDESAGSLGHIMHNPWPKGFRPDIELTPRMVDVLMRHAVCSFAGAAAAGLLAGREFDWTGTDADRHSAVDLLSYIECEPDACNALVKLCRLRARNLVRARAKAVAHVARLLMRNKRLSHDQVRQALTRPVK